MSTMDSIEEEYREEIDRLRAENAALKEANERMSESCADSDRHIERVEAKLADLHRGLQTMMEIFEAGKVNE